MHTMLNVAAATGGARSAATSPRLAARIDPALAFERVWVVERSTPGLYQVLSLLTDSGSFTPIVLAGSEGEDPRAAELDHVLELVPPGTSYWVGDGPVPMALNVDRGLKLHALLDGADGAARFVSCADSTLEPLAALAAMRLDAVLVSSPPEHAAELVVHFGGQNEKSQRLTAAEVLHISGRDEALDLVNSLAQSTAVMVAPATGLLPEHVLYAFQRDTLLIEVISPPYSSYDVHSEIAATIAVKAQIVHQLGELGFTAERPPEALVIAADWTEIPYRFARSLELECRTCDNGVDEHSADLEYANLDGDQWGEPEVPVGRLTSYDQDLLALQTVLGVWRDHGAFQPGSRAVLLELGGVRWRDHAFDVWRDRMPRRDWSLFGPEEGGEVYRQFQLDTEAFFAMADDADLVVVKGHGSPNSLATDNRQLDGATIADSADQAVPAFWILSACSTGRYLDPAGRHGDADPEANNLLSAIQSRLAFGALLSVDVLSQGSGSIWWPTITFEPGLPIGEQVRRALVAAISAYRGDDDAPEFPWRDFPMGGSDSANLRNAWTPVYWVGDPLTGTGPADLGP
jgi:hypothetical protein